MSAIFSWGRSDYIFVRCTIIATTAITVLIALGVPLWDWLRGNPLAGTIDTGPDTPPPLPDELAAATPGARLTWDGIINVELAEPTAGARLALLVPAVLLVIAVVMVAIVLLQLVTAAREQRPFTRRTVRSLWIIAATIGIGSVVIPAVDGMINSSVFLGGIDGQVPFLLFTIQPGWLALALLLGLLAEIFRIGTRLAEDVDGLV